MRIMSTFAYTAFDSKGKLFRGDIDEKSWTQALRRVKEMGLFPASVKERVRPLFRQKVKGQEARTRENATKAPLFGGRISAVTVTAFTRQLATLIDAGIPLIRGLRSMQEQEENRRLRTVIGELIKGIEGGSTLSETLERHPKVFSRLYVKMVLAGETAGMLEGALGRLADFMERAMKVRSKIKSALVYPTAVLFVAATIVVGLTTFVIPRFKVALA